MANAIKDLSRLSFDKKEWITELKNKVCQFGNISEDDIDIAFNKILSSNELEDIEILNINSNVFQNDETLFKMSNNFNIGGLYDDKEIEFSPILTVFFGKNGSGKTTYYKAIKDAFHSKQNIRGNIYKPNNDLSRANFNFIDKSDHLKFQKTGVNFDIEKLKMVHWIAGTQNQSNIKFCDSEILNKSLHEKDAGWSIDRYKLGYFDILRDGVEKVENKVKHHLDELSKSYNTSFDFVLNNLKSTEEDSIKSILSKNRQNYELIISKLSEINLLELPLNHIEVRDIELKKSNSSITDYTKNIELLNVKISNFNKIVTFCERKIKFFYETATIKNNFERYSELKNSLDFSKFDQYKLLFNPSNNKDKFIELIKKVTETALAFNINNYPSQIEKCFYCNQNLHEENLVLIKEIHAIVNNEVNSEMNKLRTEFAEYKINCYDINNTVIDNIEYDFNHLFEIFSISNKNAINLKEINNFILLNTDLESLKVEINDFKIENNYSNSIVLIESYLQIVNSEINILKSELLKNNYELQNLAIIKSIAEKKYNILLDNEFCFNQKTLIANTLQHLQNHAKYKFEINSFKNFKTKISKEKGNVEERLLRTNYISKFKENLDYFELSKRDKIDRTFSNPEGKSKINVKINSNNTTFSIDTILSEGEAKIYSLCDWLTELEFDDSNILIFDDPINSLDQVNTYKFVNKLIELSKKHQVIVFTHNQEFYHRLVQKSFGGSVIEKANCEICKNEIENNKCNGLDKTTNHINKCSSYYIIDSIIQPGHINKELLFFSYNWENRIEIIRKNLLDGNITEADKNLRTTINSFFEKFVLNDIKRKVYKNEDLIKEWREIREINDDDYNLLMDVHNKISGESSIHEPSIEVRSTLNIREYIIEFNKVIDAINNIRSHNNTNNIKPINKISL